MIHSKAISSRMYHSYIMHGNWYHETTRIRSYFQKVKRNTKIWASCKCISNWLSNPILCSSVIQSVVERENMNGSLPRDDLLCTACEMTVIWIQTQLRQKGTKDKVLQYVNEVTDYIHAHHLEVQIGYNFFSSIKCWFWSLTAVW